MWFKNLSLYRLPADFVLPSDLESLLAEHALRSPGPLEFETRGFVSPFGAAFTHESIGCVLLALGQESRILPLSVLRDEVDKRVAEHEAKTGRKPGKRLRSEFKEAALGELLPRALIKHTRTLCYFDSASRLLVVDTSSDKRGEEVCSAIREAIGSFPARPLATEASIRLLASEWLISGRLPDGLELGNACDLKDPSDTASVARFRNHDLTADEVREHARLGKQVSQLGLIYSQRIGFVLDGKDKLRRLEFLDVIAEQLDAQDDADQNAVLDAEFALMTLELRQLFSRLDEVLTFMD